MLTIKISSISHYQRKSFTARIYSCLRLARISKVSGEGKITGKDETLNPELGLEIVLSLGSKSGELDAVIDTRRLKKFSLRRLDSLVQSLRLKLSVGAEEKFDFSSMLS